MLSNHDVVRHVTRYGEGLPYSTTGLARARAALLTMLALPGSAYLYQGEELGLPEVTDLPRRPARIPSSPARRGRCPAGTAAGFLPWSGTAAPYGFTRRRRPLAPTADRVGRADRRTSGVRPRIDSQLLSPRPAGPPRPARLPARPHHLAGLPEGALFFTRGPLTCAVNCGFNPVRLPPHDRVLIASAP
nr:hypothetical protein GCM10020093_048610 [Planobispora longispora]